MKRIILITLGACIFIPLLFLILWSFTDRLPWPAVFPGELSLHTWQRVFGQDQFLGSVAVSLCISMAVTVLTVVISIPAAYAISQYAFKGKALIWVMLLMPLILPSISISIGLHLVFLKLGLTDTYLGVILSHLIMTVPYAVKILTYNFDLLGKGLKEQAAVLGASTFDTVRYVYMPNMRTAVSLSSILVFIVSFSIYLLTFLIGGGTVKTLPILLFPIMQSGNRTEISVYSLVFILTAMAATFLIEKYLGDNKEDANYINL